MITLNIADIPITKPSYGPLYKHDCKERGCHISSLKNGVSENKPSNTVTISDAGASNSIHG